MSWWEWLLVSIGGYLAVGVVSGHIMAYTEGCMDSNREAGDSFTFTLDGEEVAAAVILWPVFLIFVTCMGAFGMFKFTYNRGKTRKQRKIQRLGRKNQDQALKELCEQEGWNYKKIKAAQA